MKVLITGANGYIGSKLVKELCDKYVDVIATDIDSTHVDERATFIYANIFEKKDDWFSYFGKPDICVHMAWRDGFVHNSEKHMEDLSLHFRFVTNLIDNGLKKIVSIGTMHEIGYYVGAIDENTPCSPLSQYGIAKNAFRKSIEIYASQKNCLFQWLRCFYVYGDDKYGNSIFCKIRKAVEEGKTDFPFSSGKNQYDFLHINELVEQLSLCILQNKVLGIINCCSGRPVSLSEQVERYISQNNLPIKLAYGKFKDRPYDSPCIFGDKTKMNEITTLFDKKTVLVTGVAGQLGFEVVNELNARGFMAIGTDILDENDIILKANWDRYIQLDITNELLVKEVIGKIKPNAIIHCAAWTDVDGAENIKNKPLVYQINVEGPNNLVSCAKKLKSKFLYISTDYVFSGEGKTPWKPDESNYAPLNYYGETKLLGEKIVSSTIKEFFVVRTSWVFGNGKNFVKTMYNVGKTHSVVKVVNDQVGNPTYTRDLSRLIVDMIQTNEYGYYHATNEGDYISWYDFACEIYKQAKLDVEVIPVSTDEYGVSAARRPQNSRLDKSKLIEKGFKPLPLWQESLKVYLEDIKKNS